MIITQPDTSTMLKPQSGMLHRTYKFGDEIWIGNYNLTDETLEQSKCPIFILDLHSMKIGTLTKNEEFLDSETVVAQILPNSVQYELQIDNGVLKTEGYRDKMIIPPILRSKSFVFFLREHNSKPYLFMAAEQQDRSVLRFLADLRASN